MSMARIMGVILAVVGIGLLIMGMNATQSIGEQAHEGLTGRFTNTTTWYIIGGIAALVGGAALAIAGGRRRAVDRF